MYNQELFQNTTESSINGNQNYVNQDMDVNVNVDMNQGAMPVSNDNGVQQRVIHRTFVYEVPQDCFFMIEK